MGFQDRFSETTCRSYFRHMEDEDQKFIRRMNPPRVAIDKESCKNATIIQLHIYMPFKMWISLHQHFQKAAYLVTHSSLGFATMKVEEISGSQPAKAHNLSIYFNMITHPPEEVRPLEDIAPQYAGFLHGKAGGLGKFPGKCLNWLIGLGQMMAGRMKIDEIVAARIMADVGSLKIKVFAADRM